MYAPPPPTGLTGLAVASAACAGGGALLIVGGLLLAALIATQQVDAAAVALQYPFWGGIGGLLALACSIPAVITGHLGLSRISRSGGAVTGRPAALAGVIAGYAEIATPIICLIVFVALALTTLTG
jgi:hypothetical protein